VDTPGSSESPVGASEGGKGRFLPVAFMEDGFSEDGSVVRDTSGGLVDKSVPVIPVRASLPAFDFLFFFLVVAACPAVMVNRVLGHGRKRDA